MRLPSWLKIRVEKFSKASLLRIDKHIFIAFHDNYLTSNLDFVENINWKTISPNDETGQKLLHK